jgi:hypothetical protein
MADIGEFTPRVVPRIDSGVTWAELKGRAGLMWRIRSGVGREGEEVSTEETESVSEITKLFISDRAGARRPGSADVKALTAG